MMAVRRFGMFAPYVLPRLCTLGQVRTVRVKGPPPPVMLAHSVKPGMNLAGWYMSEKLDGIRAYWRNGKLTTRNGLPLDAPAGFHQMMRLIFGGGIADGELFVQNNHFQQTMGAVMTEFEENNTQSRWEFPDGNYVKFCIFDLPPLKRDEKKGKIPFSERHKQLTAYGEEIKRMRARMEKRPKALEWAGLRNPKALKYIEVSLCTRLPTTQEKADEVIAHKMSDILSDHGEGIMVRAPDSAYVSARSSELLKIKPFEESEAIVLDWAEGIGKHVGLVGALRCRLHNGIHFEVGTGLSDLARITADSFVGQVITVRHQGTTNLGIPRFPSFIGLRQDRSPEEFDLLSEALSEISEMNDATEKKNGTQEKVLAPAQKKKKAKKD